MNVSLAVVSGSGAGLHSLPLGQKGSSDQQSLGAIPDQETSSSISASWEKNPQRL